MMTRPISARLLVRLVPLACLLAAFGKLVVEPSGVLVDATRPSVDRARVVDASPGNDLTRQFWPLHLSIRQLLASTGRLPHWDDRGFGGRPLIGNPQAGLFYPPVWLAWLIPASSTLGWITIGHLAWASWGMIRLTRYLGVQLAGQMAAAGCFPLSPYVLAQTFEGHYPHVWAATWYPWAFAAMIRVGRGSRAAGLGLATCLAAVLLTGHPQEGFYLVIALGIWGGVDLIVRARRRGEWGRLARVCAIWCGTATLTGGLVAVELIPDAWVQPWSLRSARLPLHLASRYHPVLTNAWQLLNPLALGRPSEYFGSENYWETVTSIGLAPLILVLIGVAWHRDRGQVRCWISLTIAATTFAAGRKLGLFALMYEWVPGIDRFRVPARSLFLASLGCSVLAGFGVDAVAKETGPDRWTRLGRRWLFGMILLGMGMFWGCGRVAEHGLRPESFGASGLVEESRARLRSVTDRDRCALALDRIARQGPFWVAVVGISLGLLWGRWRPDQRQMIAIGFGLLGLGELAASGDAVLVVSPPAPWLAAPPVADAILLSLPVRGARDQSSPCIRADEAIVTDLIAVQLQLRKTDINDTLQIQHAADLYQRLYELSRPRPTDLGQPMDSVVADHRRQTQQAILDRLGVSLIAGNERSPRLQALARINGWPTRAVGTDRDPRRSDLGFVGQNLTALPRAYLVPRATVFADDDANMVDQFRITDPWRSVLMTRDPLLGTPTSKVERMNTPVGWRSMGPDRIELNVVTENPALLVVTDTWMPGWSATVDGRPVPIERGNHAQRVIALPAAGPHTVIMSYHASGFSLGLGISLGSIVAGLILGCWEMRASWHGSRRKAFI